VSIGARAAQLVSERCNSPSHTALSKLLCLPLKGAYVLYLGVDCDAVRSSARGLAKCQLMRASRAPELDDSSPWEATHGRRRCGTARTDAAAHSHLARRKPSAGSRTEAYKEVWTGRCDWDCYSVLTRVARLGPLWTPARAELWGRALTGGV
jgi:hypothetical protein